MEEKKITYEQLRAVAVNHHVQSGWNYVAMKKVTDKDIMYDPEEDFEIWSRGFEALDEELEEMMYSGYEIIDLTKYS